MFCVLVQGRIQGSRRRPGGQEQKPVPQERNFTRLVGAMTSELFTPSHKINTNLSKAASRPQLSNTHKSAGLKHNDSMPIEIFHISPWLGWSDVRRFATKRTFLSHWSVDAKTQRTSVWKSLLLLTEVDMTTTTSKYLHYIVTIYING